MDLLSMKPELENKAKEDGVTRMHALLIIGHSTCIVYNE